eukprot:maker-scaffold335_size202896-snap-gene-1.18 protein:Tk05626 transcript:maker-scaffold335_size202896-snap-gene-1.18-mRNA-1 annotation:"PREDICTED: peroxiredoxin-6-like"
MNEKYLGKFPQLVVALRESMSNRKVYTNEVIPLIEEGFDNDPDMPRTQARMGKKAPNFTGNTTEGRINLYDWLGESWGVLFSHPAPFTPICTTEMGSIAKHFQDFKKRDVKLLGISCEDVNLLHEWGADIKAYYGLEEFPVTLLADEGRSVAYLYGLIEPTYRDNFSGIPYPCRGLFIIDPKKILRMMSFHPWSMGRCTKEILRSVDSLQMTDLFDNKVCTPADWEKGKCAMVDTSVTTNDINHMFQTGVITWFLPSGKPYMRTIADPKKQDPTPISQATNLNLLSYEALSKDKCSLLGSLPINNSDSSSNYEAANVMNGYFITKVDKLRHKLRPNVIESPATLGQEGGLPLLTRKCWKDRQDHQGLEALIDKTIKALRPTGAVGADGIPVSVLRMGANCQYGFRKKRFVTTALAAAQGKELYKRTRCSGSFQKWSVRIGLVCLRPDLIMFVHVVVEILNWGFGGIFGGFPTAVWFQWGGIVLGLGFIGDGFSHSCAEVINVSNQIIINGFGSGTLFRGDHLIQLLQILNSDQLSE